MTKRRPPATRPAPPGRGDARRGARSAAPAADVEHERAVAIYDLLEENSFAPDGHDGGPYALHLSIADNRLVFDVRLEDGTPVVAHLLSLTPFRRIVKDYFLICDSYYEAIRTATPGADRGDRHGPARPAQRGLASS